MIKTIKHRSTYVNNYTAVMVDSEGNHIRNGKILKVNRHSGIGPTHNGVPSALRSVSCLL